MEVLRAAQDAHGEHPAHIEDVFLGPNTKKKRPIPVGLLRCGLMQEVQMSAGGIAWFGSKLWSIFECVAAERDIQKLNSEASDDPSLIYQKCQSA
jgi:hypothetical protein